LRSALRGSVVLEAGERERQEAEQPAPVGAYPLRLRRLVAGRGRAAELVCEARGLLYVAGEVEVSLEQQAQVAGVRLLAGRAIMKQLRLRTRHSTHGHADVAGRRLGVAGCVGVLVGGLGAHHVLVPFDSLEYLTYFPFLGSLLLEFSKLI
jgi:hypothetical protein